MFLRRFMLSSFSSFFVLTCLRSVDSIEPTKRNPRLSASPRSDVSSTSSPRRHLALELFDYYLEVPEKWSSKSFAEAILQQTVCIITYCEQSKHI
jgi:hypothetical protein